MPLITTSAVGIILRVVLQPQFLLFFQDIHPDEVVQATKGKHKHYLRLKTVLRNSSQDPEPPLQDAEDALDRIAKRGMPKVIRCQKLITIGIACIREVILTARNQEPLILYSIIEDSGIMRRTLPSRQNVGELQFKITDSQDVLR